MKNVAISEFDFRQVVESAPSAIMLTDEQGYILYANAQAEQTFEFSPTELLGKNAKTLLPDRFTRRIKSFLDFYSDDPAEQARLALRDLNGLRKDGSEFPIELNVKPFESNDTKFIRITISDITERKKAESLLIASESRFRRTLDSMLEGAQIVNFFWKYVYVNDALEKQAHYKKHELLGYTVMEKYPGIEQSEAFVAMKKCMEERVAVSNINEFTFPDGSKGWFELMIQPVPEGIFILSQDITARRRAELEITKMNEELEQKVIERTAQLESFVENLRESEEKFNKAFEASAAAIAITRLSDSTYIEVNQAFVELTGYSRKEIINKSSRDLGIVVDMQKREEILSEIRSKGSARNFEFTIRDRSGKIFEVLGSCETIMMRGEQYAINVTYDITERKRAEEQLQMVNKELEAFSYSVSHDLRAPLRAINGYAQMLNEDFSEVLNEEGKRLLDNIRHNAAKMGSLIDDLLSFSRLGRKELQKTIIDMNDMMEGVLIELNKSTSHNADIRFSNLHSSEGDYGLIHQVLFNLVSNAVKYSSKKEKPVIEISSEAKGGDVIFSIKDNGAGFNMKYANKLFGVFQRLHSNEEFEGTGVGLAIVQRILAKHQGKIWAEGQVGEGATFYFSLPNTDSK